MTEGLEEGSREKVPKRTALVKRDADGAGGGFITLTLWYRTSSTPCIYDSLHFYEKFSLTDGYGHGDSLTDSLGQVVCCLCQLKWRKEECVKFCLN